MSYFVIIQTDTEASVVEYADKESLLADLGEYGDPLDGMPYETSPAYWDERPLIIKGKIVVPKAKKVVEKWEIE